MRLIQDRYRVTDTLAQKTGFTSYEATDLTTNQPVIAREYNTIISSVKFDDLKQEVEKLIHNPIAQTAKIIEVFTDNLTGKLVIIIERPKGRPLSSFFFGDKKKVHPFSSTTAFLKLALNITGYLKEIHKKDIPYLNIHHASLFIDAYDSLTAMPPSFSFFSSFENNSEKDTNPSSPKNDFIHYLAPEQIEGFEEGIDFRTDFFSLGVLFYLCLFKKFPFEEFNNSESFINALASKKIVFPHGNRIYPPLKKIIEKLLSKSKSKRYQSVFGLEFDLKRCLNEYKKKSSFPSFTPGTKDIPAYFSISDRAYGREAELSRLLISFYKTAKGHKENIFITGGPGVGKTKLIQEFSTHVMEADGIFISGRFTKAEQQIPYVGFKEAFSKLLLHIMAQGKEETNFLKEKIRANLGQNAKAIHDIVPELELLTGPLPELPETSPIRNKNRFFTACRKFFESCLSFDKPMVLFLDDLHWADQASLELFALLSKYFQNGNLLIIGAYRSLDNESTRHLSSIIESMRENYITFEIIEIDPIATHYISELLQDSFGNDPGETVALANLIFQQTHGNPFQIHQYIFSIHAAKLIWYNFDRGIWEWDLDRIYRKSRQRISINYINDVLKSNSEDAYNLLVIAACCGSKTSMEYLSIAASITMEKTKRLISEFLNSGLVFILKDKRNNEAETLYFRHHTIQQTVLESISRKNRAKLHYSIGKNLHRHFESGLENDILYDIVYHLNRGETLLDSEEKFLTAELNFKAAENAVASSSGSSALTYLDQAKKLLGPHKWLNHKNLCTEIFLLSSYSALISGNYEKVYENTKIILENNHDIISQLRAYEFLINAQISENRLEDSIKSGIHILTKSGVNIPEHPKYIKVITAVISAKFSLFNNPEEKFKNLESITDEKIKIVIRILALLLTPSYLAYPRIHPLITSLLIKLSLKYGYSPETAYGLAAFGISLCSVLNDYSGAFNVGELSVELAKKEVNSKSFGRTLIVDAIFLKHWKSSINSCIPLLRKGKESALEIGDYEFGAHGIQSLLSYGLFSGHPLIGIKKELEIAQIHLEQMNQKISLNHIKLFLKFTSILLKERKLVPITEKNLFNRSGQVVSSEEELDLTSKFFMNFCNTFIYLYTNNIQKADKYWKEADKFIEGTYSLFSLPYHLFFGVMISLLKYEKNQDEKYDSHILSQAIEREKRFKIFINKAPENHIHRYYLIKAEKLRIAGEFEKAETFFNKAISTSREKDFSQDEAFFCERAGIFFNETGKPKTGYNYFKAAAAAYQKWGCMLKLSNIEDQDGQDSYNFVSSIQVPLKNSPKIFKLLRFFSELIDYKELITQFMDSVIEISGATHGYFISFYDNIPYVKSFASADSPVQFYEAGITTSTFSGIIEPIINNVYQTGQIFYPEQASKEYTKFFTPHAKVAPKSLICIPLTRGNEIKGLLYLENTELKNVFNQEKIETLTIMVSHLEICVGNSDKFSNMQEKIGHRQQTENILQRSLNRLEDRIKQRTSELIDINKKLQFEIESKTKAQKALIQSETKYKTLVEKMNDGLGVQDKKGFISYVNEKMCQITGMKREELIGSFSFDVVKKMVENPKMLNARDMNNVVIEESIVNCKGEHLDVLFQGQNLYDEYGNFEGSFAVVTDITKLNQMTNIVKQNEKEIRALLNATSDSVIMIESSGKIITANSSAAKRFGYSPDSFMNKNIFDLFSEEFISLRQGYIDKVTKRGEVVTFLDYSKNFVFDITLYPVINDNGDIDRIAVYAKDITELKKAEEQISSLSKELIKAQENERKKIALDLHDHVAQNLSFFKITLDAIKNTKPDDLTQKIDSVSRGLKSSIEDIRHIAYDLRPPNLDELGLAKALYQHCEEFSFTHGIEVDFSAAGIDQLNLDFDVKINIFRIIQEALNNIQKHANASMVRIRLISSYPDILLRIEDNGDGFDIDQTKTKTGGEKMGLKGMRERAGLIKGTIDITSSPGQGTKILAKIPYPGVDRLKNIMKEMTVKI